MNPDGNADGIKNDHPTKLIHVNCISSPTSVTE